MSKKVVAAFDFDGTLTKRDTLIPFALFVAGPWLWLKGMVKLAPQAGRFLTRRITRQQLKERTIAQFLGGMPYAQLQSLGEEYAREVIPKFLKKRALEQLSWHRDEGHLVVLVSASPEAYLEAWAKQMNVPHVLCSRLEVDKEGKVTGRLIGKNCRGQEKVRRLQDLLGEEKTYELYAYGDSPGDRELLDYADHSFYRKI